MHSPPHGFIAHQSLPFALSCEGAIMRFRRYPKSRWVAAKVSTDGAGYPSVTHHNGKCSVRRRLHRLLAEVFLTKPDGAYLVRHLNGDKADYRLSNLAWGTDQENANDAQRLGETATGSDLPHAKLTEETALTAYRRIAEGERLRPLAKEYGVSYETLTYLAAGKTWAKVTGGKDLTLRRPVGSLMPLSKYSERDMEEAFKLIASGKSCAEVEDLTGVKRTTLIPALHGKTWKHVPRHGATPAIAMSNFRSRHRQLVSKPLSK